MTPMTNWVLLRAAGIGAYVALFLAVVWGVVSTTGVVTKRVSKPAANSFHAFVASVGLALLALHIGLLLIDQFMPFSPLDVVVPMRSTFRPLPIAFGVVAMYVTVAVVVSSWVRKRMSTVWWRRIHLLSVPAFVLVLLHGVFAGTDTQRPWMIALYGATGVFTLFLVLVRGLTAGYRAPRQVAAKPSRPDVKREPASAA